MQASLERLRRRREELGDEGGFTLIELLIVIVILGILAAIVVFAVQNLTTQSAKASCGSDYKTLETSMETFKAQVGHYPMLGASSTPGPAVTGDNWADAPNPTAAQTHAGVQPSTFVDGVDALWTTQTGVDGNSVGPWLKDAPQNGNLYRLWVAPSATGAGDAILVQNLATTPLPAASASVSVSGGTITADATGKIFTPTATNAGVNGSCSGAGL